MLSNLDSSAWILAVGIGIVHLEKIIGNKNDELMERTRSEDVIDVFNHSNLREGQQKIKSKIIWLVVSTHLKNISQNGNLPQIGVKIKNI